MSTQARRIAQFVPYMRRFARAVLGDQDAGDRCVRHCLERLLGQPGVLDRGDLRLNLFRALNDMIQECAKSGEQASGEPIENASILLRRIGGLDPLQRRLILLTTLEGMSLADAGHVLRLDEPATQRLLATAKQALREQRATRILIIEDEPVIALDIATTIERHGHSVVGIAMTRREAVAIAREQRPGLVLADIQLADQSSGLDAVQEILSEIEVPVIFITAYPERLLTGERPEPTFLITKPFDSDTLAISIAQALATTAQPPPT
jgi:CheY-like chemotaxis protein